MELNSKAGEEHLNQLDRYFEAVQSVILARQHPVTSRSNYWLRRPATTQKTTISSAFAAGYVRPLS